MFRQITGKLKNAECVLDDCITVSARKENEPKVKDALAEVTSRFIIDKLENERIKRLLTDYGFDSMEAAQITGLVKNDESLTKKREALVREDIQDYLKNATRLNVDGMVDFRLRHYKAELTDAVESHIQEYMTGKAYVEFLELLKYFVSIQDPQLPVVHVRGDAGSGYVLTDGWGNLLKNAEDDEFIKEAEAGELSHDDLLISKLIAFSPNKIILHGADQGAAIFKTLRQIFENRLEFRRI